MSIRLDDAIIRKLEIVSAGAFKYTGIETATGDSAHPIWFAKDRDKLTTPVYSDTFRYNPIKHTLTILGGEDGTKTTLLRTTDVGNTLLTSDQILYLSSGSGQSIVFRKGETEHARFDNDGHLIPASANNYNLGSSNKQWKQIYSQSLNISGTTNATSATTGSIITAGGIGVAKDIYSAGIFTSHKTNGPRYAVDNGTIKGWFGINTDGTSFGIYESTNEYYLIRSTTTAPADPTPKKGTTIPLELTLGQRLIFTGTTSGTSQIYFSRENNPSYFKTATGGYFCFIPNGAEIGTATSVLTIKNGSVQPGTTNTITLGTSSLAWSTVYADRYTIVRNAVTYGYMQVVTEGTTDANGLGRLSLGNNTASGAANNARGELLLYGLNTGYVKVQASITTAQRYLYLRDHGANAYVVATAVTSAVGSNQLPVYVNDKGIVATVSKVIFSNTTKGTSFAFTESRTEGSSVSFGVGSGNVNHGIYSNTLSKWIAYADTTGVYLNGNANTATALKTGRTLKVALNSTNASTAFNGEANVHDIGVSGTLAPGNGGTGQTTLKNAANSLINALDTGSSTPTDADYYISQYVGGGTTTTTYHRRPMSALWSYISGKSDARYVNLSGDTMTGSLTISHATNATMNHTTTNPRIVFSENGNQPVGLVYTDYDTYRHPAGLKVLDMSGSNGSAWFEVQGSIYSGGNIYTIHPTGGETNISVAHGSSKYLMLWGNNSSGARGLWDTTKGSVITVTDTASTFHGNASSATELKAPITFTPAETALTPANVKSLIGTGSQIRKGSWSYAGNGYIANGSTATSQCPFGAIDLAGTTVIQSTTGTEYTQIYITPPTANTSGAIKGEMIYYIDQGSGYSPTWYRVLTNSNYTSYTVKKDGTGATGTWGINISGNAATASSVAWGNITGKPGSFTPSSHTHNYLTVAGTNPVASGTDDTTATWGAKGNNTTWWYSDTGTLTDKPSSWGFIWQLSNGTIVNQLWFSQSGGVIKRRSGNASGWNGTWRQIWQSGDSITGAVWNDYAEYRESDCEESGRVLFENGNDSLSMTTKRLQHFAGVSSDTWGFCQGETEKAKTPIAVAGRVLVYTYQDRNNYKPGDCVCAAPGGTVDIMTREEIIQYPDRIVGTVSCVPEYNTWGSGDRDPVNVNGRIWIKVK